MAHWLVKTEPSTYSFADLVREKRTAWTGIKNAAARLHLRAMKRGDTVLVYHTGSEKAVVGKAKVASSPYPDPADEKGTAIDLEAGPALKKPVTLAQIKSDPRLQNWALVKIGRLSVVHTTKEQYEAVISMGG